MWLRFELSIQTQSGRNSHIIGINRQRNSQLNFLKFLLLIILSKVGYLRKWNLRQRYRMYNERASWDLQLWKEKKQRENINSITGPCHRWMTWLGALVLKWPFCVLPYWVQSGQIFFITTPSDLGSSPPWPWCGLVWGSSAQLRQFCEGPNS